ncbi:histidine phosphatase family protein [Leptospira ilyithenensis]|uniref:Histidine phosphatase family protein n=1 Tax=Leptospira ilyithenensis TaxID=2484901 RepID=A0A4V3JX35_9LEPT|nr:histidine phosphatase family protein [Leptospira ilyithenensis]TGN11107.1 histidine phosphatase family protein [Leptospira ilyithenensis]
MGLIYLVRHGQADRLGKDYDTLTDLGKTQARLLGRYFIQQRIEFDSVFTGNLQRQKQTASGILESFQSEEFCTPKAIENENWNEFDPRLWLSLAAKIRNEDSDFAKLYENYKTAWENGDTKTRDYFQELIQRVLDDWVNEIWDPVEPYSFSEYVNRIVSGFESIPKDVKSSLVVSSSTPVAIAMGLACGMEKRKFPVFMKSILNSSLSIFKRDGNSLEPVSWNSVPHLYKNPELHTII